MKKQDKTAWGMTLWAAGLALLAEGLIELCVYVATGDWLNTVDLIKWITPVVFSVMFFRMALKYAPELKYE